MLGISFKRPSTIICEVEAYPASVKFRWFFNSSEYEEWKSERDFTQIGLRSELEFLPKSSKDYGSLFCIGENAIGRQEEACVFQIVPTGKPSPLTACQIVNKTLTSLKVQCQEGFDGGLPANFLLELYDAQKMELKSQVTNKVPIFEVSHIDPGTPIKLYLYAENAKGTSDPAIIDDASLNQQKHYVEGVTDFKAVKGSSTSEERSQGLEPSLLLILVVFGAAIIVTASTLCIFITFRRQRLRSSRDTLGGRGNGRGGCGGQQEQTDLQQRQYGSNPDLIPVKHYPEGCHYMSDLDSSLLLSSSGCSSREAVLLQHPPLDQGLALDGHLIAPASPPLQYSDSVSYVGTNAPLWGGFDSHHRPSTLDRHRRGQQSSSQSGYHTCDRRQQQQQGKKKVTIKEKPDDESEV